MDSNTFAENLKKKYPEYQSIDNATLVRKVVEKYPVYKSQITDYTATPKKSLSNLGSRVSDAIKQRGSAFSEATSGTNGEGGVLGGIKGAAQAFGAVADVGEQIIRSSGVGNKVLDKTQEVIGKGINAAADKISDIPLVRDAALSGQTKGLENVLQGVAATGEIAGTIAGAAETGVQLNGLVNKAKNISNQISKISIAPPTKSTGIAKGITDIVQDVTPKAADLRDRSIAKALRLAPVEDISVIKQSTGNDIGEFMGRYDLIKDTPGETAEALKNFQKQNYDLTRDAISLVDERYGFKDVPDFETTIDFLMEDLGKRKSPEYVSVMERLNSIKTTGEFDLMDVQYVKEVFDDVESIYKRTGDVRDAVAAQDKAQVIASVRRFIEDRVQEAYPDVDIRQLNNNVQTSRAILDAVVKRAPKADTANALKLGDFAVIGLGNQVSPGLGFATLFGKKLIESSPLQLRMARYWSGKSKDITDGMTPKQLSDIKKMVSDELRKSIDSGDMDAVKEIKSVQKQIESVPIIKETGKVTPEIKENIVSIIDDYRLNKGKNLTLQEDAAKIAEDMGIQMPKTYGALITKLEKLVSN